MTKKNETTETTELAPRPEALPPADFSMFENDLGQGFEDTSRDDYAIPFLSILQAMSPQCTMGKPQYNEDLRPGMFYNSVTEKAYAGKTGVLFVPAKYQRVGILWEAGKNDGTGFRGVLSVAEMEEKLRTCTKDDKNHDITEDGLVLVNTCQWYGLLLDEETGATEPVLLSLKSTQLKKSKRWLTLAQNLRHKGQPLPLASQVYRLTSVPEQNDQGAWMGLDVKHVGIVPSVEIYEAAKQFKEMVESGVAKEKYDTETSVDDEVPF